MKSKDEFSLFDQNRSGFELFRSRALVSSLEESFLSSAMDVPLRGGSDGVVADLTMSHTSGDVPNLSSRSLPAHGSLLQSESKSNSLPPAMAHPPPIREISQDAVLTAQERRNKALHLLQRAAHTAVVTNDLMKLSLKAKKDDMEDKDAYHTRRGDTEDLKQIDSMISISLSKTDDTDEKPELNDEETFQQFQRPTSIEEENLSSDHPEHDEVIEMSLVHSSEKDNGCYKHATAALAQEHVVDTAAATSHPRNAGQYTIIAFVNSASGGGMGHSLYKDLCSHLGPTHVFDLNSCRPGQMPEDTLIKYAHDPMVKILACGGDGTMGWIFSSLDSVWATILGKSSSSTRVHASPFKNHLPLAIMPLGTGNDLSRQFGWGGKFEQSMRKKNMIMEVQSAILTSLDRWRCIIMPAEAIGDEEKKTIPKILAESLHYDEVAKCESEEVKRKKTLEALQSLLAENEQSKSKLTNSLLGSLAKGNSGASKSPCPSIQFFDGVFCNYFSLGFDATVAYLFHHERENHPEKFTSPLKNKLIYVEKSPAALRSPKLRKRVVMYVNNDKGELIKLKIPKSCRAIIIMNIQSYAGGHRLSNEGSSDDGLVEVIFVSNLVRAVTSLSVGPILPFFLFKVGAQTNKVCIRTKCPLHFQVDGEPWLQEEGVIQIKFHSRNAILEKENNGVNCGCMGNGNDNVEYSQ